MEEVVDVWDESPFVPRQGHRTSSHNVDTPETARIPAYPPLSSPPPLLPLSPPPSSHQRRRLFRRSPTETPSSLGILFNDFKKTPTPVKLFFFFYIKCTPAAVTLM